MEIILYRHAKTAGNLRHAYIGTIDEPLCAAGIAEAKNAYPPDFSVSTVFVSPLTRAKESARIWFPHARQIVVPGLSEMNFGIFEGKNYKELNLSPHAAEYQRWIDSFCTEKIPEGESQAEFISRTTAAFERIVRENNTADRLILVAHGGTALVLGMRYLKRGYFDTNLSHCGRLRFLYPEGVEIKEDE